MSTDPISLPLNGAASPPAAKPKPKFDQRYIAPLFITCVLIAAHVSAAILVSPLKTGTAILTAIAVEIIVGRIYFGKWPHLASAYVTGISVGILLRSEVAYWPYAFCSAISILSKYVIRVQGRHIWNPSNFGIAMTLIVAPWAVHTLSQEFGNSHGAMVVIWILGSFIVGKLKRFHICATYVLSFLGFAWIRHLVTGDPYATEIGPITGPMYQLFTFFMITDPKTTVHSKPGQVLVTFLVAAVECLFRLMNHLPLGFPVESVPLLHNVQLHAPYYALFLVGPTANLIEIGRTKKAASSGG